MFVPKKESMAMGSTMYAADTPFSPDISMANVNLQQWEDDDGIVSEVGTFTVRGAELVGFLEFGRNYPKFTHTFQKSNKRVFACAPNLCFGRVVAGDRLISIDNEDLWDSTKEFFYDFMKHLYDQQLEIQVDRGHRRASKMAGISSALSNQRSSLRLLFKHDQEIHPGVSPL